MAKIIKLILTHDRRGFGTADDPVRLCPQLWTLDGNLVAEHDPVQKDSSVPRAFVDPRWLQDV